MSIHPCLVFCPYLPLKDVIEFADWRLGPLEAFENWSDPRFKERAETFLRKFVDAHGRAIENPTIIGPRSGALDGQVPAVDKIRALQVALDFGFLDANPRYTERVLNRGEQAEHVVLPLHPSKHKTHAFRGPSA